MNKKIGIVGSSMGENSFGVQKTYLEMISKFGDPVIIMPNDGLIDCDLLILPGGADVNPSVYGETPSFYTSNSDVFKQAFYDNKLKLYIENRTPIFGICLGLQMIATFFGSKLTQHLGGHPQSSSSRSEEAHKVHLIDNQGRVLADKKNTFGVNSLHHQGLLLENMSDNLIPTLVSEGNQGIIEGLRHKSLPIAGVQFHPEENLNQFSINCILDLLKVKEKAIA